MGLPAPLIGNGTWLLHVCIANNPVVTNTIFQHKLFKSVHLQKWHNPDATDSTKHQVIMFCSGDVTSKLFRMLKSSEG